MRNHIASIPLSICLLMLVVACSKEDNSPSGGSGGGASGEYGFSAMIDTATFRVPSEYVKARLVTGNAGNVPDYFEIGVMDSTWTEERYTLWQFGENMTMADVQLGQVEDFLMAFEISGNTWIHERNDFVAPGYQFPDDEPTGEFIFTEVSATRVKGTFEFVGQMPGGTSKVHIVEGTFEAEIE
ncbi:MAG: hypothetical protein HKN79_04405 [Flavobacteriales bacterium]|nr:hypothetical protein [Flavobacteriales bacterium]